jgi:hypothetical protein
MPTISVFYGVTILMFWKDHGPPHFHVRYGGDEAVVDIHSLSIAQGHLPRRAAELTLEWARLHKRELLEDWELCARKQPPKKIPPLD